MEDNSRADFRGGNFIRDVILARQSDKLKNAERKVRVGGGEVSRGETNFPAPHFSLTSFSPSPEPIHLG